MMTIADNKEIVRRAFDALMAADLTPLRDLLVPDAVLHQCGFLDPIPAQALLQGAFPGEGRIVDREVRLERMVGEGDLVALHWRMDGRFADPDAPEIDGTTVSVPWMTFVRLENGKIVEIWNIRDSSTLETQLREPAEIGTR